MFEIPAFIVGVAAVVITVVLWRKSLPGNDVTRAHRLQGSVALERSSANGAKTNHARAIKKREEKISCNENEKKVDSISRGLEDDHKKRGNFREEELGNMRGPHRKQTKTKLHPTKQTTRNGSRGSETTARVSGAPDALPVSCGTIHVCSDKKASSNASTDINFSDRSNSSPKRPRVKNKIAREISEHSSDGSRSQSQLNITDRRGQRSSSGSTDSTLLRTPYGIIMSTSLNGECRLRHTNSSHSNGLDISENVNKICEELSSSKSNVLSDSDASLQPSSRDSENEILIRKRKSGNKGDPSKRAALICDDCDPFDYKQHTMETHDLQQGQDNNIVISTEDKAQDEDFEGFKTTLTKFAKDQSAIESSSNLVDDHVCQDDVSIPHFALPNKGDAPSGLSGHEQTIPDTAMYADTVPDAFVTANNVCAKSNTQTSVSTCASSVQQELAPSDTEFEDKDYDSSSDLQVTESDDPSSSGSNSSRNIVIKQSKVMDDVTSQTEQGAARSDEGHLEPFGVSAHPPTSEALRDALSQVHALILAPPCNSPDEGIFNKDQRSADTDSETVIASALAEVQRMVSLTADDKETYSNSDNDDSGVMTVSTSSLTLNDAFKDIHNVAVLSSEVLDVPCKEDSDLGSYLINEKSVMESDVEILSSTLNDETREESVLRINDMDHSGIMENSVSHDHSVNLDQAMHSKVSDFVQAIISQALEEVSRDDVIKTTSTSDASSSVDSTSPTSSMSPVEPKSPIDWITPGQPMSFDTIPPPTPAESTASSNTTPICASKSEMPNLTQHSAESSDGKMSNDLEKAQVEISASIISESSRVKDVVCLENEFEELLEDLGNVSSVNQLTEIQSGSDATAEEKRGLLEIEESTAENKYEKPDEANITSEIVAIDSRTGNINSNHPIADIHQAAHEQSVLNIPDDTVINTEVTPRPLSGLNETKVQHDVTDGVELENIVQLVDATTVATQTQSHKKASNHSACVQTDNENERESEKYTPESLLSSSEKSVLSTDSSKTIQDLEDNLEKKKKDLIRSEWWCDTLTTELNAHIEGRTRAEAICHRLMRSFNKLKRDFSDFKKQVKEDTGYQLRGKAVQDMEEDFQRHEAVQEENKPVEGGEKAPKLLRRISEARKFWEENNNDASIQDLSRRSSRQSTPSVNLDDLVSLNTETHEDNKPMETITKSPRLPVRTKISKNGEAVSVMEATKPKGDHGNSPTVVKVSKKPSFKGKTSSFPCKRPVSKTSSVSSTSSRHKIESQSSSESEFFEAEEFIEPEPSHIPLHSVSSITSQASSHYEDALDETASSIVNVKKTKQAWENKMNSSSDQNVTPRVSTGSEYEVTNNISTGSNSPFRISQVRSENSQADVEQPGATVQQSSPLFAQDPDVQREYDMAECENGSVLADSISDISKTKAMWEQKAGENLSDDASPRTRRKGRSTKFLNLLTQFEDSSEC